MQAWRRPGRKATLAGALVPKIYLNKPNETALSSFDRCLDLSQDVLIANVFD